jgi:hypothetical protein
MPFHEKLKNSELTILLIKVVGDTVLILRMCDHYYPYKTLDIVQLNFIWARRSMYRYEDGWNGLEVYNYLYSESFISCSLIVRETVSCNLNIR